MHVLYNYGQSQFDNINPICIYFLNTSLLSIREKKEINNQGRKDNFMLRYIFSIKQHFIKDKQAIFLLILLVNNGKLNAPGNQRGM